MLGVEPDKALDGTLWDDQEKMVMGLWAEFEAEQTKLEAEENEKLKKIADRRRPR
jgi:hypothetical protein